MDNYRQLGLIRRDMMNLWLPSTVNDLKATVMTVPVPIPPPLPSPSPQYIGGDGDGDGGGGNPGSTITRSEQGPAGGIVTRAFAMGGFVTADNPGIVWAMLLTAGGLPM